MSTKPQKDKDKPLTQLSAWLRSASIPVLPPSNLDSELGDDGDQDYDLTLLRADGEPFEIHVSLDPTYRRVITSDTAVLRPCDLDTLPKMHEVFHLITEKAGYGKPNIVNRGPLPKGRLNYSDDFDLIVFRHCELRRVPNPTTATLLAYKSTQLGAARNFLTTNHQFCASVGLELDDLMTYAGIWTCNFYGQYELRADRSTKCDNQKLLFNYLRQRFAELRKTLYKRVRNTMPDYDTAATGLYDRPFVPSVDFEADSAQRSAESILMDDSHGERCATCAAGQPCGGDSKEAEEKLRRASAAARLQEALMRLPHDELVERLTFAMENAALAPDARDEARRQLHRHAKTCGKCGPVSVQGLEEDEEPAAVHAD